jgi:phosphodiesterase/alkaline phosphatase D-like protein
MSAISRRTTLAMLSSTAALAACGGSSSGTGSSPQSGGGPPVPAGPSALLPIVGAVTDQSFAVVADIQSVGDGATQLEVATDPGFTTRALLTNPVTPYRTARSALSEYQSVRIEAQNLKPNTVYYYRFVVEGVPGAAAAVRTFPTAGVAAPVTFAIGSCNPNTKTSNYPAFSAIKAAAPAMFFHIGDIAYSNIRTNDITLQRAKNVRAWKAGPIVSDMLQSVPVAYMFDNHDSGGPLKDADSYPGTTWEAVLANSQQAYLETFPHYSLPVDGCLAQEVTLAKVRIILLDGTSFYRRGATPTVLGATQLAWLKARLLAAAKDDIARVFIVSPPRWVYWKGTPDAAALWNFIRDTKGLPQLTLVQGDVHYCGVDDGLWVDRQVSGVGKVIVPMISASGLSLDVLENEAQIDQLMWNGVPSKFNRNYNSFVLVDVDAQGEFTARIYGDPYNGVSGTLLGTYSSKDLPKSPLAGSAVSPVSSEPVIVGT